jgi:hypothetical protein
LCDQVAAPAWDWIAAFAEISQTPVQQSLDMVDSDPSQNVGNQPPGRLLRVTFHSLVI